jgi:DNA-binding transcriptional regulator YiaG
METNERIRSIREKTGLNRREFSDKYGIPVRTLEEWEAGRRTPPEYVVRLLSYVVEFQLIKEK